MTLDNTLSQVREGMTVVDASDEEIGTVAAVQLGDPGAATAEGQGGSSGGLLGSIADALSGGGVEPQAAAQLARTGYLKVDTKGLGRALYAGPAQVAEVTGQSVRLNVDKSHLYA